MDDLTAIVKRGYESKDLDYKAPISWSTRGPDKKAACELVKDIMAMANTLGGHLVIGVSETPSGLRYDGLTNEQASSFDSSKVNSFIAKYAEPPINCKAVRVACEGNDYVVILVPVFEETPTSAKGTTTTPMRPPSASSKRR
jgi:predicted HTH transcriptional regulator